ncbi:AAA family ATPase [Halomonas sp. Bachu 37]|uniref:AAA family ATPase n=1 Tax=Halomonas kashgarensis TaxID=3084920 RepID=UPI003216C309
MKSSTHSTMAPDEHINASKAETSIPLGYGTENPQLLVDERQAALVRSVKGRTAMETGMTRLNSAENSTRSHTVSFQRVDLTDLMSAKVPEISYIFEPLFPRRFVTLLAAHGGAGKTSLAIALAAHAACGREWAGFSVEACRVLFLTLEDDAELCRKRLRDVINHYDLDCQQIAENLLLLDGTTNNVALMSAYEGYSRRAVPTESMRELNDAASGIDFIIIDNASDAFDGDENIRREVRAFIHQLTLIACKNNASLVLLGHVDKHAARGGDKGNFFSGSTAWHNHVRSRLAMIVDDDGKVNIIQQKLNVGKKLSYELELGFTGDGVIVPAADNEEAKQDELASDQEAIIRAMQAAYTAGIVVPASVAPGAHSAMNKLQQLADYGKIFKGRKGRLRASYALESLHSSGRIRTVNYKTPQRKIRTCFELVEQPGWSSIVGKRSEAAWEEL